MKGGLWPVAAVAGGFAAVLVWSMLEHDPYWRLFEIPSVPAPTYEPVEDLGAVLASVTPEFGNTDAGAISPTADPLVSAGRANIALDLPLDLPLSIVVREAEAAVIPEPIIALVPPFEPEPMTGPAIDSMIAHQHRPEYRVHRRQPTKVAIRIENCGSSGASATTNCGTKAMKKTLLFGFSAVTAYPNGDR